jgi:hypothetical protein
MEKSAFKDVSSLLSFESIHDDAWYNFAATLVYLHVFNLHFMNNQCHQILFPGQILYHVEALFPFLALHHYFEIFCFFNFVSTVLQHI